MNFSLKLSYHKVYFSATWCKKSLLYDQTIEDINIFSHAFWVELRGVAQLPGGSNYPTLPYICGHFVKANGDSRMYSASQ